MAVSNDQVRQELERRFRIASDRIAADQDLDFETFLHISEYVDFIESTPTLLAYVEVDRVKWTEKRGALENFGLGWWERLRHTLRLNLQSDFYFSRSYWRLLHVYYAIKVLKDESVPTDFEWSKGFKKAVNDMEDIQIGLVPAPLLLWPRNSFLHRQSHYQKWLERTHAALTKALFTPEQTTGLHFDQEKSILTIGDKRVRLTLKNDKTNAHYVLQYIFDHGKENPADFTDILNEQFPLEGMDWRAMYRACKDIENKVREQAGITDFLTTTTGKTGWVKINPLYA